jgi:hypothetical protein
MLPTDLFLERIGVEEEVREDEIPAYLRKMREKSGRAPVAARQVRRLSLLQFLMEEMAHGAADNSPTMLKKATRSGLKEGEVPFFPPVFVVEISRLTALARFVLEQDPEATLEQVAAIDIT